MISGLFGWRPICVVCRNALSLRYQIARRSRHSSLEGSTAKISPSFQGDLSDLLIEKLGRDRSAIPAKSPSDTESDRVVGDGYGHRKSRKTRSVAAEKRSQNEGGMTRRDCKKLFWDAILLCRRRDHERVSRLFLKMANMYPYEHNCSGLAKVIIKEFSRAGCPRLAARFFVQSFYPIMWPRFSYEEAQSVSQCLLCFLHGCSKEILVSQVITKIKKLPEVYGSQSPDGSLDVFLGLFYLRRQKFDETIKMFNSSIDKNFSVTPSSVGNLLIAINAEISQLASSAAMRGRTHDSERLLAKLRKQLDDTHVLAGRCTPSIFLYQSLLRTIPNAKGLDELQALTNQIFKKGTQYARSLIREIIDAAVSLTENPPKGSGRRLITTVSAFLIRLLQKYRRLLTRKNDNVMVYFATALSNLGNYEAALRIMPPCTLSTAQFSRIALRLPNIEGGSLFLNEEQNGKTAAVRHLAATMLDTVVQRDQTSSVFHMKTQIQCLERLQYASKIIERSRKLREETVALQAQDVRLSLVCSVLIALANVGCFEEFRTALKFWSMYYQGQTSRLVLRILPSFKTVDTLKTVLPVLSTSVLRSREEMNPKLLQVAILTSLRNDARFRFPITGAENYVDKRPEYQVRHEALVAEALLSYTHRLSALCAIMKQREDVSAGVSQLLIHFRSQRVIA